MIAKIKAFFKALGAYLSPYKKNIIIPLLKILAIIIVCAIIARYMSGHETLAEFAAKKTAP